MPENSLKGVCRCQKVPREVAKASSRQKTVPRCAETACRRKECFRLLPKRMLLPAAEKNVSACRRRECCRLPPKRMLLPVAEENVAACRKRKLSVGKKVSNQDAKKTASQKEGCLKSICCCERLLPLNSCAWFWRHIVANAVYCRNLS